MKSKIMGPESSDVGTSFLNLGGVYLPLKKYEKALEYTEMAKNIFSKTSGKDSLKYGRVCFNISVMYKNTSQMDKAIEAIEEGYQIYKHFMGEDHPHTKDAEKRLNLYRKLVKEQKEEQEAQKLAQQNANQKANAAGMIQNTPLKGNDDKNGIIDQENKENSPKAAV